MTGTEKLQELIDRSARIVFFGGAGVSTESGIPDFRSVDGLYNQQYKYPPETIISHTFFTRRPEEFYEFYRAKMLAPDAKPNPAHLKLHQKAGSREVLELHGSVHRNYCMDCRRFYDARFILASQGVPRCVCGGVVKPDVVLYEESLDGGTLERAVQEISACDLLIIGGTSLAVYPAAGLIRYCGGKIAVINKSATPMDGQADLLVQEPIGRVLGAIRVRAPR